MSSVTLTEHPRFVLVEPSPTPARVGPTFQVVCPSHEKALDLLYSCHSSEVIAIDFETRGNDYSLPRKDAQVVGIGLSWDEGSVYIDAFADYGNDAWNLINRIILEHPGLIAHNVYFDGGWIRRDFGRHPRWLACTFGLYMQCASEGWEGQKWGLKEAMVDVLRWQDTNEHDLDQWLIDNGYCKQNKSPLKGEMWRAPPSILGKYCVLDAEATYLLYTKHLEPITRRFPRIAEYHQEDFLPHVLIHIDQKMHGIAVNREQWLKHADTLRQDIVHSEVEFRSHLKVAPLIEAWEEAGLVAFLSTEPPRYKKVKERTEPKKYTASGKLSKNWEKWYALSQVPPEESKVWQAWKEREAKIRAGEMPGYRFNIQSGDQLRWLLYDNLQYPIVLMTETGLPAVGEDALQTMGDVGKILVNRNLRVKELSYIDDYLSKTENRNTIHPSFKLPGTVTGRLAGKSPNLQQLPKTVGTLSGFISRPGYSFVDCDVNALEMVVTAELSQDRNLLALYGPGAKKNDIYLFYGSMMAGIGPKILSLGYDPYNPTTEAMDATKKAFKKERSIAKLLILSDNYGSGVKKKQKILSLQGVDMTLQEVQDMHNSLLEAKSGVMAYVDWLRDQWRANKGWVENGYGLPICVDEKYEKDLLNRVVQGTGHCILQLYARIASKMLTDSGIEWYPIVMDWHDESIVEVRDDQVEQARTIMEKDAYAELNRVLGGTCPLKGSAAVAKTLAGIKLEE